jgi:hypothetical protein
VKEHGLFDDGVDDIGDARAEEAVCEEEEVRYFSI